MTTESDNETFDTSRTCFILTVLFCMGMDGYSVIFLKTAFNVQSWGIGMGALTAAFGFAKKQEGV